MGALGNLARAHQLRAGSFRALATRLARGPVHPVMSVRELVLSYARGRWHARGGEVDLVHRELRGLEGLIEAHMASEAAPVEVRLQFDMSALPRWLHQYHGHYCNYTLRVPPRG